MTEAEKELDKAIEFLQECEQYLHSWCCTRTGKYQPVDTRNVRKLDSHPKRRNSYMKNIVKT